MRATPSCTCLLSAENPAPERAIYKSLGNEKAILGEAAVGKRMLLALVRSLAERWIAERKVVRLVTVPDFLRELRAGYDAAQQKQGESYHELMERYQMCDVLVFNDVGAEKLTDWLEEQLYLLVDYRYWQRLPVLASS